MRPRKVPEVRRFCAKERATTRTIEIPILEPMAQACQGASNAVAPAIPQAQPNTTPMVAPFIPVSNLSAAVLIVFLLLRDIPAGTYPHSTLSSSKLRSSPDLSGNRLLGGTSAVTPHTRWDEKAGLPRDAIRSQCSTCSRHKEKETGNAED